MYVVFCTEKDFGKIPERFFECSVSAENYRQELIQLIFEENWEEEAGLSTKMEFMAVLEDCVVIEELPPEEYCRHCGTDHNCNYCLMLS